MPGRPSKYKPGSSSNDKAKTPARPSARAKTVRPDDGVQGSGKRGKHDGTAQDGRDGPAREVGPVPTAQDSPVVGVRRPVPYTATQINTIDLLNSTQTTFPRDGVRTEFPSNRYTPEYIKPGRITGFFARRLGKHFRPKEKPVSPTELKQAQKFNVSTAAGKGVDPLLSKKAAGVVALITMVLSGYMGHEVAVDQMSIDAAIQQGVAIWMAVNTLIAGVTWFYKVVRNVYTEWGRIKEHGVKISGENAAFDFAPRDGE